MKNNYTAILDTYRRQQKKQFANPSRYRVQATRRARPASSVPTNPTALMRKKVRKTNYGF